MQERVPHLATTEARARLHRRAAHPTAQHTQWGTHCGGSSPREEGGGGHAGQNHTPERQSLQREAGSRRGSLCPGWPMRRLLLPWVLPCLGLALLAPAQAQAPLHPSQAPFMARLKAVWGNFLDLSTWKASTPCQHWTRVTCWDNGTVRTLDVSGSKIYAQLPRAIGGLRTLEKFYAYKNNMFGPLPTTLGLLSALKVLYIHSNYFTGPIPPQLGLCSGLYSLELNVNFFSGVPPRALSNLRRLQYLNIGENWLTGTIPGFICTLTHLTQLRLSNNHFTGSIPGCLQRLQNAKLLYIDTNRLTGRIPPVLGYMPSLQNLFLNQNSLVGPIPASFSNLRSLKILFLSSNPYITGPIPSQLGYLPELTDLVMEFCAVNGTIPWALGRITTLRRLLLDNNFVSGFIPASLGNLKQLNTLLLESNYLVGRVPASIPRIPQLQYFQVNNNQLSGPPPTNFINRTFGVTGQGQYNIHDNFFTGLASFSAGGVPFCPTTFTAKSVVHYSSIRKNCLSFPAHYRCTREPQLDRSICRRFCGADRPSGPCSGHGTCWFYRSAPSCACYRGYRPTPDGQSCIR